MIASCALPSAAFARFPFGLPLPGFFYAELDLLILLGAARDLILNRHIHRVYLYALPAMILGQVVVVYTGLHDLPYWHKIGDAILR